VTVTHGPGRRWNVTRWVDDLPGHDLVLSREVVQGAPAGAMFSIEAEFGPNGVVPISVERRRDGTWIVHSRGAVPSEALIGGRSTPRHQVSRRTGEEWPRKVEPNDDRGRLSFAEAAALIAAAQR
jgi:hypothetical protein